MKIWSQEREEKVIRPSTYYGSALFVGFSLVILGTSYMVKDLRIFAATFSVGAALVAIVCYFALVSTISRRAKRMLDVGSPCGYAAVHTVGACPDTHINDGKFCQPRTEEQIVNARGIEYKLGDDNPGIRSAMNKIHNTSAHLVGQDTQDPQNPALRLLSDKLVLNGMDSTDLRHLCEGTKDLPYVVLNTMGPECVRK